MTYVKELTRHCKRRPAGVWARRCRSTKNVPGMSSPSKCLAYQIIESSLPRCNKKYFCCLVANPEHDESASRLLFCRLNSSLFYAESRKKPHRYNLGKICFTVTYLTPLCCAYVCVRYMGGSCRGATLQRSSYSRQQETDVAD